MPHLCALHAISLDPCASLLRSLGGLPRALPSCGPRPGLRRGLDDVQRQLAQRSGLALSSYGLGCARPQQHERHHVLRLKNDRHNTCCLLLLFRLFLIFLPLHRAYIFVVFPRCRTLSGRELILVFIFVVNYNL